MSTTIEKIERQIAENPIPAVHERFTETAELPVSLPRQSRRLPHVANVFRHVDILQNPDIRAELPKMWNGRPSRNCGLMVSGRRL